MKTVKGVRLVFCEHCSRIFYFARAGASSGGETAPRRRRRRTAANV